MFNTFFFYLFENLQSVFENTISKYDDSYEKKTL